MFKRILIANRGEIACRIIATCRRLGIETVAVYSEADHRAMHVRLADRAVTIGGPAPGDSYLRGDRILAAAKETGAEAVHPGYGFLSENTEFARAAETSGIVFIGPSPETMEQMGSKARAKATMEAAGVPLVPGYHGDDASDEVLIEKAREVGFPLMLKAAAGGGGKGMRVVANEGEMPDALRAARRESKGAFGDDRMILERYLERPRHIEAQVFGDSRGNLVHLFERDCSSQRRHQKVLEEAPAPGLSPETRQGLLEAAVKAARAVDYVGAGTVEFLVEGDDYFFLEMNTRLQVEHPVTELITGLDLVEWQLRIASGEPLPADQEAIGTSGHAMEARLYAEDPEKGFLPATGRINRLDLPEAESIRVDSGVESGDSVSMHYDPMIAKLVVHGSSRAACLARMQAALAGTFVGGLVTNLGFLGQLAGCETFREAGVDTGFLDRNLEDLLAVGEPVPDPVLIAAACAWLDRVKCRELIDPDPWSLADGWRPGAAEPTSLEFQSGGREYPLLAWQAGREPGSWLIGVGEEATPRLARLAPPRGVEFCLGLDGERNLMQIHQHGDRIEVIYGQRRWRLERHTRFHAIAETSGGSGRLLSPMPGKVLEIRVSEGDQVGVGETLAVMEAMKMEMAIKAPADGVVKSVNVAAGDIIEADVLVLEVE